MKRRAATVYNIYNTLKDTSFEKMIFFLKKKHFKKSFNLFEIQ